MSSRCRRSSRRSRSSSSRSATRKSSVRSFVRSVRPSRRHLSPRSGETAQLGHRLQDRRLWRFDRASPSLIILTLQGKRYSRNDELGVNFSLTVRDRLESAHAQVDFASVSNSTVTLRERDSTSQRIGSVDEVLQAVHDLVTGQATWADACSRLAEYSGAQDV